MDQAEIEIINKCQAGDTEAFGRLYDKYIKKIYDFVYYKTHHPETAEDLVSQVFMKALRKITDFKINQGTFQAWIYRIARNTVIDHYRTSKIADNIEDIWDLAGNDDTERDIDTRNKLKEVEAYLTKLKPEQRDIIIMRVWQGMSYQEIALVLAKTEAGCKMVYSRAIRRLRDEVPLAALLYLALYI